MSGNLEHQLGVDRCRADFDVRAAREPTDPDVVEHADDIVLSASEADDAIGCSSNLNHPSDDLFHPWFSEQAFHTAPRDRCEGASPHPLPVRPKMSGLLPLWRSNEGLLSAECARKWPARIGSFVCRFAAKRRARKTARILAATRGAYGLPLSSIVAWRRRGRATTSAGRRCGRRAGRLTRPTAP